MMDFLEKRKSPYLLAWAAIILSSFSSNTWVTSISPLFHQISKEVPLNPTLIGLLTLVPALGYPLFSQPNKKLAGFITPEAMLFSSCLLRGIGELLRSASNQLWMFIFTALICSFSTVMTNSILPMMVKKHFEKYSKTVSAQYTTVLALGMGTASLLAAPLAQWGGSWRVSNNFWAIVAFLCAIVVWLAWAPEIKEAMRKNSEVILDKNYTPSPELKQYSYATTGLLACTCLITFTLAGWLAYYIHDRGYSELFAGTMLGIVSLLSLPRTWLAKWLEKFFNFKNEFPILLIGAGLWLASFTGLVFFPEKFMAVWCIFSGFGAFSFNIVFVLMTSKTKNPEDTHWLSTTTLSRGYLISAIGPLLFGILHQYSQQWYLSFAMLMLTVLGTVSFGYKAVTMKLDEAPSPSAGQPLV